jgi:hypothetical protein
MTFEYKIIPVQNNEIDSPYKIDGFSKRKKTVTRKLKKDRRRKNKDRRSSIRTGVIVNLSSKADSNRRKGTDRRKYHFTKIFA